MLGWIHGRKESLAGLDPTSQEALELQADLHLLDKVEKDYAKGFPVVPINPRANLTFTDNVEAFRQTHEHNIEFIASKLN